MFQIFFRFETCKCIFFLFIYSDKMTTIRETLKKLTLTCPIHLKRNDILKYKYVATGIKHDELKKMLTPFCNDYRPNSCLKFVSPISKRLILKKLI